MNYDPMAFDPVGLLTVLEILHGFKRGFAVNPNGVADAENKRDLSRVCDDLHLRSKTLKLESAIAQIGRIRFALEPDDVTYGELSSLCEKLSERIEDELALRKFLFIPPASARRYDEPLAGWKVVLTKFPHCKYDVEEAGRCSALRRHTASVFHLMRVIESLPRVVSNELGLDPQSPTWNSYLMAFQPAVTRKFPDSKSAEQKEWRAFYLGIKEHLQTIKDAWRNDLMHNIATKYGADDAGAIYTTVFLLMNLAATKLQELEN